MTGRSRAGGPQARERSPWVYVGIILVAAIWLYAPTLAKPFFADDYLFLDQVRGRSLGAVLAAPDPLGNFFRPVGRQLYFWTIARTAGETPLAFHAVNLALFLLVLVMLFEVARRVAGAQAGVIATGLLALHYAADVPVRWASGGQELLAVLGALASLYLYLSGRRVLAAVPLLLGAFSKETVLLAPLVALVADRKPGEPWLAAAKRAWPLGAAVALWALVWLFLPERRAQQGTDLGIDTTGPFAALAHLVQVALGFEWRQGEFGRLPKVLPPLIPLALVLAAVAWGRGRGSKAPPARTTSRGAEAAPANGMSPGVIVGLAWAGLGAVPIIAAAAIWSAYHYLFAMCGVTLALGAWLAARPMSWSLVAIALLAVGSASSRAIDEFAVARTAWTGRSHVNRFYIERANHQVERYLGSLKRARPSLAHGTTLFLAGLKGNVAFQTTDGPLLRWAYRDSSLRSYYVGELTRDRAHRGPVLFFIGSGDTLKELPPQPDVLRSVAQSLMVSEQLRGAREALLLELERDPSSTRAHYCLAWVEWARGDSLSAVESLRRSGANPAHGPAPQVNRAFEVMGARDTMGALHLMVDAVQRYALDPGAHALLADISLVIDPDGPLGVIESFATRVLVPEQPYGWRRWAMVQAQQSRYLESLRSFERYFALLGPESERDLEARVYVANIRKRIPGGDLATEGLRE